MADEETPEEATPTLLFWEVGAPKLVFSRSAGVTGERKFIVHKNCINAFIDDLAGSPYPEKNDTEVPMWVTQISQGAFDENTRLLKKDIPRPMDDFNEADWLLVTASYGIEFYSEVDLWPSEIEKPEWDDLTTLKIKIEGAAQMLTIPGRSLRRGESSQSSTSTSPGDTEPTTRGSKPMPPEFKGRIWIPLSDYRLTWDLVADPPISKYAAAIGCVNAYDFLSVPEECLLMDSYQIDYSYKCARKEMVAYKIDVVFKARQIKGNAANSQDKPPVYGWNHLYVDKSGWTYVTYQDGRPLYKMRDFSDLFKESDAP